MNCRYCGSSNSATDHRCHQCGRRLHLAAARAAPDVYPTSGSLAAEPRLSVAPFAKTEASEGVPEAVTRRAPYQPALFPTRDLGRVVPIEAYKQRATERRERAKEAESFAAHQRQIAPPESAIQTDLPFSASASNPAQRGISESRYSKAPVATFDGTNAGLALKGKPVFSVQHHPEASPGPTDSLYLFERFTAFMDQAKAEQSA